MGINPICWSNKLWICLRCLKSCFNGLEEGLSFHLQPQFIRYSQDNAWKREWSTGPLLYSSHNKLHYITISSYLPVTAGDKHGHKKHPQKWARSGRCNEHRGFYDTIQETHSETDSHDDQTVHNGYRLDTVKLVLVLHTPKGRDRSQEVLESDGCQRI